jgi:hypothetical protein
MVGIAMDQRDNDRAQGLSVIAVASTQKWYLGPYVFFIIDYETLSAV